jgi:hypothetical protein
MSSTIPPYKIHPKLICQYPKVVCSSENQLGGLHAQNVGGRAIWVTVIPGRLSGAYSVDAIKSYPKHGRVAAKAHQILQNDLPNTGAVWSIGRTIGTSLPPAKITYGEGRRRGRICLEGRETFLLNTAALPYSGFGWREYGVNHRI